MFYMGSWALGDFNDAAKNKIGAENVGFMPFPAVDGRQGLGRPDPGQRRPADRRLGAKSYDAKVGDWLSCITKNYGAAALKDQGSISGFKPNGDSGTLPPLTQLSRTPSADHDRARCGSRRCSTPRPPQTSQTNAAPLVTGSITAQDFMKKIQSDLDDG